MGVPNSEVGYTLAMCRREDHEVHKRTCGGIGGKNYRSVKFTTYLYVQIKNAVSLH
jgi:hypothetical protein